MNIQTTDFIQFAADIAALAEEGDYDFNTVLNGLAISSAAFLVDLYEENGDVDDNELAGAIVSFGDTIERAAKFAVDQLRSNEFKQD